jgi:hypothetical protein
MKPVVKFVESSVDRFLIQMGLKQVYGISTLLHNFVVGYTIRKIQEYQRLEMNGIYCQFLFYVDKVKLLGKITSIIKEKRIFIRQSRDQQISVHRKFT